MGELTVEFIAGIDRDFERAVEAMKKVLVDRAPNDTGRLEASIRKKVAGRSGGFGWRAEITTGTDEEYPSILDSGSGPHIIRVRRAKVLTDGLNYFGVEVNHPGSTADVGWWSDPEVADVFDEALR